jgi:hypothetical protein
MAWEDFSLDKTAHDLVYEYRNDDKETVNQVHKMRTTVAYGLERFWGEHLRLDGRKSAYWEETWNKLVEIMGQADITPAFLTNNAIPTERFAIAIYIILIEKRFRAFFTRLIFDAV